MKKNEKNLLLIVLCLLLIGEGQMSSQQLSREFGKLGKPEADFKSYPADKSAAAVVLFDIGKSWFEPTDEGMDVIFERTKRVKIFSEAGLKWAEIEIPFYQEGGSYEKIFELEAATYNPSGESFSLTPLNPATCHDEKLNNSWQVTKFAFPDAKPGSIVEYRYKLRSPYKFNLRNWEFQSTIPVIYSEYEVSITPFYEYQYVLQGARKFDETKSYESTGLAERFGGVEYKNAINIFIIKNIPAFNDEEYITSMNDFIIRLDFQLTKIHRLDGNVINVISTWPDLVKTFLKDASVTKFAEKCEKLLPKLIPADSLDKKTEIQKFNYILDFVKANFSWNKSESKFSSKSPNELVKDKLGNEADLNLLTIGLLNAAGMEAYPLFISTRDNGRIKTDFPLIQYFNYIIIDSKVEGKSILTDATNITCQNDRVPAKCLNDKGLLIKEGPVEWISLHSDLPSEKVTNFTIDSVGKSSHTAVQITASEYDGSFFRQNYGFDKKKIAGRGNPTDYPVDEASIMVLNQDVKEKPYILNYSTSYPAEIINKKIYVAPFPGETMTENPMKQESRSYSIDMSYPVKRTFNSVITIPEGYKIDFVPEEEKVHNDLFELYYNVKADGNKVNVSFTYTFKKSVYLPSDYINLKYYFKDIIKKENEKIVFVSKM